MRVVRSSMVMLALLALMPAGFSQRLIWLTNLGGGESEGYSVSADGRVVVGRAKDSYGVWRAARWENGVIQDLGDLGGFTSWANDVSADGRVVVGGSYTASGTYRAFRWENGVMIDLGTLGGSFSAAFDVSADGRVVVGWARDARGAELAFRWQGGTMENLGSLAGNDYSTAYGVSANGVVVVGVSAAAGNSFRAVRWFGGIEDLGTFGDYSTAYGVSDEGRVVVGNVYTRIPGINTAFRWTASRGMENLNQTYANLLTNGSTLTEARAVTPDGRCIVGGGSYVRIGTNWGATTAFWLNTEGCASDVNGNGFVDDTDLLLVLFAFGCTSNCGTADVNGDGAVNDTDLLEILFSFGQEC